LLWGLIMASHKDFLEELKHVDPDLNKALLKWYIVAKFGDVKYTITDGPKDGGIDAVIKLDDVLYVLQSKFKNTIFIGRKPPPLPPSIYSEFDKLPEFFKDDNSLRDFLKTVTPSLHLVYREIGSAVQQKKNVILYFITLYDRSKIGEGRLKNTDPENFQYYQKILGLFELSLEGGTPPPLKPLQLPFTESFTAYDHNKNITTYILQAPMSAFIEYAAEDREFRILARNVRTDLRSRINEDIRKTFINSPDEFWYSHNGVTIVCDKAIITTRRGKVGKVIRINEPSVINGAQTLHALKEVQRHNPNALVLVRVIVIPSEIRGGKDLINSIIFRTNQQNKMFAYDLRANDLLQVRLARDFLEKGVFYERRRKEWELNRSKYVNQGFRHIQSTKLAQILMACEEKWHSESGVAIARKNIEYLFEGEVYNKLFSAPFPEIYFKYKLHEFIKEVISRNRKSLDARQKNTTLLTCLAVSWNAIGKSRYLQNWLSVLQVMPKKMDLRESSARSLKNVMLMIFNACWKRWRSEQRKNRDLNIHDFFKSSTWNDKMVGVFSKRFYHKLESGFNKTLSIV
jgi:hypothetical protein